MEEKRYDVVFQYCKNPLEFSRDTMDDDCIDAWRQTGIRNLYIFEKLKRVIAAFDEKQIPVIVLKGALLANTIYPFGVRPHDDIDLLVKPEDFHEIDNILRDLGYMDSADSIPMWTHQDFANKITYYEKGSDVVIPVDLHFSLGPYPYLGRIGRELLWSGVSNFQAEGMCLNGLNAEVQLLHLCLHLFQHLNECWIVSCCDLAAVIRYYRDSLDWSHFVHLVKSTGIVLPVKKSLEKVGELFGDLIPDSVKEEIKQIKAGHAGKIIFSYTRKNSNQMDRYFIQYISTPGFRVKIKCLGQILLPGRKFIDKHCAGSYVKYYFQIAKSFVNITKSMFV